MNTQLTEVLVNYEIAGELDFIISDLVRDGNLPTALNKIINGERARYGVSISITTAEADDLIYYVKRDRDYKAEVVLSTCLSDRDARSAAGVRRYISKCNKLINLLNDMKGLSNGKEN